MKILRRKLITACPELSRNFPDSGYGFHKVEVCVDRMSLSASSGLALNKRLPAFRLDGAPIHDHVVYEQIAVFRRIVTIVDEVHIHLIFARQHGLDAVVGVAGACSVQPVKLAPMVI